MSTGAGRLFAHLLSLARPVLGAAILMILGSGARDSFLVLPAALAACASDYFDGPLARRSGGDTTTGRLIDGLCDAGFLALALVAMARAQVWSGAALSAAASGWRGLDLLPVVALTTSFGVYLVRMSVQRHRGQVPARSTRGHRAGIANYALVLLGAAEVWPALALPRVLLELCCVAVALLNFAAVGENLALLFPRSAPRPTMRS